MREPHDTVVADEPTVGHGGLDGACRVGGGHRPREEVRRGSVPGARPTRSTLISAGPMPARRAATAPRSVGGIERIQRSVETIGRTSELDRVHRVAARELAELVERRVSSSEPTIGATTARMSFTSNGPSAMSRRRDGEPTGSSSTLRVASGGRFAAHRDEEQDRLVRQPAHGEAERRRRHRIEPLHVVDGDHDGRRRAHAAKDGEDRTAAFERSDAGGQRAVPTRRCASNRSTRPTTGPGSSSSAARATSVTAPSRRAWSTPACQIVDFPIPASPLMTTRRAPVADVREGITEQA